MDRQATVLIVGGGLAGLACARRIEAAGVRCLVLEAADRVGGRVATDHCEGFLLDRGFQVLSTAYPEAKRLLDYPALRLRCFIPGAAVRYNGAFHVLSDPWRDPVAGMQTLFSPLGALADKFTIARLRHSLQNTSLEELRRHSDRSTRDLLAEIGFSRTFVESFLRPFLSGIFLERELTTSRRKFDFVFRSFAAGDAALPEAGMSAIPAQLAAGLSPHSVRLGARVRRVQQGEVELVSGERLSAPAVVVATPANVARELLQRDLGPEVRYHGATCYYYGCEQAPQQEGRLILNGEGRGRINHLAFPSNVAPSYAPPGKALVSVNVIGVPDDPPALQGEIRGQLAEWFGIAAREWRFLRHYAIRDALPAQDAGANRIDRGVLALDEGLVACGDYCEIASQNGALASGRQAAETVLDDLSAMGYHSR